MYSSSSFPRRRQAVPCYMRQYGVSPAFAVQNWTPGFGATKGVGIVASFLSSRADLAVASAAAAAAASNLGLPGWPDIRGRTIALGFGPGGTLPAIVPWSSLATSGYNVFQDPLMSLMTTSVVGGFAFDLLFGGQVDYLFTRADALSIYNAANATGRAPIVVGPGPNGVSIAGAQQYPGYPYPSTSPPYPDWHGFLTSGKDDCSFPLQSIAARQS